MAAQCPNEGESHRFLQEYTDSSTSPEDNFLEGVQAPSHVPCSWRDQLESTLGKIRVKELPGRVLHDILCALPETVCVLNAPLHPSCTGSESVILAEQGAASALQAKLLGTPDATGYLLVPHCHPAVTHVQLALACCQVLVQLANEIMSVANRNGPGCPIERVPVKDLQRVVLDLLNEVMTRTSEYLSEECPDSTWGGVQLEEDHAEVVLEWVEDLDIVHEAPLRHPVWRQGAVECIADNVVQPSDRFDVLCFRQLMDAACGRLEFAHLAEILPLREALRLPRLPLNWLIHNPSYELRPSRALLHVLWEQSGNRRVSVASHEISLGKHIPRSTAADPESMFTYVMSWYGVDEWLKRTPFSMTTSMPGTPLLHVEPPAGEVEADMDEGVDLEEDGDLAPGAPRFRKFYARYLVIRSSRALLMVDIHWEAVMWHELQQPSDPTHVASAAYTLCEGGCEIQ